MKLYLIQWGYSSSNDGCIELDSIWTDKIKAQKYFHNKATERHLTKKNDNYFSDGDYWITISEINSDSEYMYG